VIVARRVRRPRRERPTKARGPLGRASLITSYQGPRPASSRRRRSEHWARGAKRGFAAYWRLLHSCCGWDGASYTRARPITQVFSSDWRGAPGLAPPSGPWAQALPAREGPGIAMRHSGRLLAPSCSWPFPRSAPRWPRTPAPRRSTPTGSRHEAELLGVPRATLALGPWRYADQAGGRRGAPGNRSAERRSANEPR
jgi:hypothetical protein